MAKTITEVNTTQTFSAWLDKTNELANAFANVISVDAEAYPTGTAGVNGAFVANTLTVTTGLLTANASANIIGSAAVSVAVNVGANVTANTSAIKVGSNVIANSSALFIGNSSVNTVVSSNNLIVGGIITANGGIGDAGEVLRTDGSGKVYWGPAVTAEDGTITDVIAGNGLLESGTTEVTVSVNANNGITANSTGTFVRANNGIVANSGGVFVNAGTGIVANSLGAHVNSAYIATISANNATYLGGQLPAYYTNATNISTGTLSVAQGGTGTTSANGTGSVIRQSNAVFLANTTITKLVANDSLGTSGYVLTSNGNGIYWSEVVSGGGGTGDITGVTAGSGLTGGAASGEATLSVLANNGIIANSTGTFVDASSVSVGTLPVARGGTGVTSSTGSNNVVLSHSPTFTGTVGGLTKAMVGLGSVENTALSTWTGSTSITTLGTITVGVWNGTEISVARGGTGATSAPAARTNLGATTLGSNIFTITNPSAVRFPRFNADNTISSLSAADFRTAIGAGTSSTTGTVTSVATGDGLTGGTITGSGTLSVDSTVIRTTGDQTIGGTKTFSGGLAVTGTMSINNANGSEGGEFRMQKPITGSTISGDVVVDLVGNALRIFEASGTNRGVSVDITGGGGGVGSALLHSTNYNTYAPTLTGGGASGNWGINITGSAGAVSWTNVSGRPTAVSAFTNDSGYITSSGSITGSAGSANVATYINADNNATDLKIWTGTAAEYASSGKFANTLYFVSA